MLVACVAARVPAYSCSPALLLPCSPVCLPCCRLTLPACRLAGAGDSLGSRGLTVLKPSHMPTPGGSRKAGGTSAAAGRAKATFMSPANSAASSIKRWVVVGGCAGCSGGVEGCMECGSRWRVWGEGQGKWMMERNHQEAQKGGGAHHS